MQLPKIIKRKEKEEGISEGKSKGFRESFSEGYRIGIREGSKKTHDAWTDWNRRRIAAGENFNEPPPKLEYN